jgi:hypothetical protein
LIVGSRDASWQSLIQDRHVGAPIGVDESRRDRHLADELRVDGLRLEHLDDLLAGDQPGEAAW